VSKDPGLVSVIVYCDGRVAPLSRTLESLARQTLAEFAVLLVGMSPSQQELRRIAPALVATNVREVSLRPFPGDVSTVTRNEVVGAARGRFVIELSGGDWIEPTAIEEAAWALETTPDAGLVAIREPEASRKRRGFGPVGLVGLASRCLEPGEYMLRTAAWREVGGFDAGAPAGAADQDLVIRMVRRGWKAQMIPEALTHLHEATPPGVAADEVANHAAAQRWLHSRHRRFYARATVARLRGNAKQRLRRRAPFLFLFVRRVVESGLRLLPRQFRSPLRRRLNLSARPEMWAYEPPRLDLPSAPHLRPMVSVAAKPGQARRTQLLVVHQHLRVGGAQTAVFNLLTRIDPDLFDVHLIATDREPLGRPIDPLLRTLAEQTDSLYRLPSFLEKDHFLSFLIDFIHSRRIDVVLVSLSVFTYQALPQLRAACPDTAFLDLLHAEAPYAPMDHIRLARRYRQFLDRRVVTTETLRSAQITQYGETADRVVVIPNGIDTAIAFNPAGCTRGAFRRELGLDGEVAIVLFFGRMSSEKQPMHVVRVAELLRERSDIAIVLVGDGPEAAAVKKAISVGGLTNTYLSPTRDDIRIALADADLVMFPSKREGLPMAGIESMSMGKPVVAAKVPGWLDLVSDGVDGFLVDNGDYAGYANAITRLVGDPALYQRVSRAGREKATRMYDLSDNVRAWERLLADSAGRSRDPST
jgi:glycosyltransferase involved in cell wall biosynthesis